jgi:hypothetical protein
MTSDLPFTLTARVWLGSGSPLLEVIVGSDYIDSHIIVVELFFDSRS